MKEPQTWFISRGRIKLPQQLKAVNWVSSFL